MPKLVLVRHGESVWNKENKFTGWVDVDLSEKGRTEALRAGERIKDVKFDKAYTSALKRAQETLSIILKVIHQEKILVEKDKALNERMYGDLQGLNKEETEKKYGKEQVRIWRRSYDVAPPGGESLKDTAVRTLPYYESKILTDLKDGKNILVVAHGNSLRSIVMFLDKLTQEEVLKLELATGVPIIYDLNPQMQIISKKELK